jgi:RNA polymerase sigma factor (sigma-70 family)
MSQQKDWTSARLLTGYQAGDQRAADAIFNRYLERLTRLARTRLSPRLASRTDPDDVVMSAWRSFFVGARAGQFSLLRSGDLWRLLVSITLHKLYRQVRRHSAELRSVNAERPLSLVNDESQLVDHREPTPEEALALSDELETLFVQLDPFARRVIELRLQGEQLAQIAKETGRAERTVRRTLVRIRQRLTERLQLDQDSES